MLELIARARHPKMWSIINIETHNTCNLKCKHCPYASMTRPKERMPPALFKRVVDDADKVGIKKVNLNIYGEPLLDTLLFGRVTYCKNRGLEVQFTSNGTLLDGESIRQIIETKVDKIYFSFDGATRKTYEEIRVGANFESVRSNILRLWGMREDKPEIIIVMVVQRENKEEVGKVRKMWRNFSDEVQSWPIDNRRELGNLSGSKGSPCYRLFSELNVLSSGKVTLCCLDYDGREVIGNLKEQSIKEIWDSNRFKEVKEAHLKGHSHLISLCRGCGLPSREKALWLGELCHL